MKLYPIFPSLCDVFLKDGWENWSRWKFFKGSWHQVGGQEVKHPALIIKALSGGK